MQNLYKTGLVILILWGLSFQATAVEVPDEGVLKAEAMTIVKTLSSTLKPKLKEAIQTGGLQHAISVCATEAPKISRQLSEKTGWMVKRVSLKPRNKLSAFPDDFERTVLEKFNIDQTLNESGVALEHAEIVDNNFRYMRAQVVEAICLNCHGTSLSPDTRKALKEYYPEDAATGYALGQIRGAFSLIKEL
jgi:hypothetical protein